MNSISEAKNDQIRGLEKCILFDNPFVGPSQDNKKKIETFFKTQSFNPENIEALILSYAGGDKLIENGLKDSNLLSSGHVWDTSIYNNVSDVFDCYVQSSTKSCEYFIWFIEKIIGQLKNYNNVSKFISLKDHLCQFQSALICDLYSSLLKHVKMTNYQRLCMIVNLLKLCKPDSHMYYEFIFNEYCKTLPFTLSQVQKEELKKISIHQFFFKK